MADKHRLLKQNAEDGFFADGDPLAELALIASFDPQGETRPRPVNIRREPEFNLEDELLKEFEQFEEPARVAPSLDAAVDEPELPAEPVLLAPPVYVAPAVEAEKVEPAAVAPEPRREVHTLHAVPEPAFEAPAEAVRPAAHPVFDLEDEILREFAAFDARRQTGEPAVEPATANVSGSVVEPVQADMSEPPQQVSVAPVPEVEHLAVAEVEQPDVADPEAAEMQGAGVHDVYAGYGDDDLAVEAEVQAESASVEESALEAMEAEVDPVHWQQTKEPIIADDDSFAPVAADEASEEPVGFAASPAAGWDDAVELPAAALDDDEDDADFDAEDDSDLDEDEIIFDDDDEFADAAPAIEAAAEPAAHEPVVHAPAQAAVAPAVIDIPAVKLRPVEPAAVAAQPAVARTDDFGLDELLADVERYPVVTPARQAYSPEVQAAAPAEKPAVQAAAPTYDVAKQVVEAVPATTVERHVEPQAELPKAAAKAELPPVHEPFDDGAFELDLTEIELDMLEMEVESSVAPGLHQDQIVASTAALADVARERVEERPALQAERSFAPPRVAEDYSSLPFDPSQISSEEDPVEALADMDVPDAPVADHGITAPTQPDYDIDIDAEMAHIFSRTGQPAKPAEPVVPAALSSADLDEFERALEEDFRRSLSENRATSTPDRVALTPASYDNGDRQGSLGRRLTILAASVAGLVLIGGAAVYAYWGSPGKILSTSSEPKIILADKDPVKVQPKDRGGQIVPNQDKAVYDRVSGDEKDVTKQDRLVTSNEEPVDVVQKTLMPENLPMDDDDQANATDTTDTSDPRLLPDGQDKNITTTEKVVSGVSPRKVRTMVVRSDGTLVPRDDDATTADAVKVATKEVTPAEESQERSLDITPAATDNVPERLTANDAVAKEIQAASNEDSKAFVPEAKQPADATDGKQPVQATDAQAADMQAVTETQTVTDSATAKTEEKPAVVADADAKSADIAPVKKEELPAAATQTDTTAADSAVVAQKTANDAKPADQAALKDAANADVEETAPIRSVKTTKISANTPIPENRPVDQPVDIVGRVTDKGNVQKTEEVASADPVQQPADSTKNVQTPAGAYVIQIASLPSEAEAKSSYNKLSAKFASVIGGHSVDIRKASIKNKGTYYRVRIVAGTRQEATELCSRYKSAGGSCLVSK